MAEPPSVITGTTASSPDSTADLSATLLNLPAEVRLNIYRQLFMEVNVKFRLAHGLKLHYRDGKITAILWTCRLLRAEAMPVLHATARFHTSVNLLQVLRDFSGDYGRLAESSRFAKMVMQMHRLEEIAGIGRWIGPSHSLQDLVCHVHGMYCRAFGGATITIDMLYASQAVREAQLSSLMSPARLIMRNWPLLPQTLKQLSEKLNRLQDARPEIIVYLRFRNLVSIPPS
jgi:hypothetical protein